MFRILPFARVAAALVEVRPEGANDNVACCELLVLDVVVFFAGAFLAVDWLSKWRISQDRPA